MDLMLHPVTTALRSPTGTIPSLKLLKTASKHNDSDMPSSLRDHLNNSLDFDFFVIEGGINSNKKKRKYTLTDEKPKGDNFTFDENSPG
jgi:hypothetical protein